MRHSLCGSSFAGPAGSGSSNPGDSPFSKHSQQREEPLRATATEGNHAGITSWLLPQIHVTESWPTDSVAGALEEEV